MEKFLNYSGQLRLYSALDVAVFAFALTKDTSVIAGIVSLWLSFILYLESRHKDEMRLLVGRLAWVPLFVFALYALPWKVVVLFWIFSVLYTKKKQSAFWGVTSSLWRGLQNGCVALILFPQFFFPAMLLTAIRNSIGDFRDAGSDRKRGIRTLPVAIGIKNDQLWAFYGHLSATIGTTVFWFSHTGFSKFWLGIIVFVQIVSYPLTPRLSNPPYLKKWYSMVHKSE